MEDLIKEFEKVMDAFNEAYSEAETDKDRDKVTKKHEKLIDKAQEIFDKGVEDFIQKGIKELEQEEKDILASFENEIDEDLFIKIKKAYTVSELRTVLKESGVKLKNGLKEDDLIHLIFEYELTYKMTKIN